MRARQPLIQLHSRVARPLCLPELQRFTERALHLCLTTNQRSESALKTLTEINLILISDQRMTALHQKFFGLRGSTDVITFQHGDIFISVPTAARNALRFGTSLTKELRLYIVHGLLHLHGFDDTTPMLARKMETAQSRIVAAAEKSAD